MPLQPTEPAVLPDGSGAISSPPQRRPANKQTNKRTNKRTLCRTSTGSRRRARPCCVPAGVAQLANPTHRGAVRLRARAQSRRAHLHDRDHHERRDSEQEDEQQCDRHDGLRRWRLESGGSLAMTRSGHGYRRQTGGTTAGEQMLPARPGGRHSAQHRPAARSCRQRGSTRGSTRGGLPQRGPPGSTARASSAHPWLCACARTAGTAAAAASTCGGPCE